MHRKALQHEKSGRLFKNLLKKKEMAMNRLRYEIRNAEADGLSDSVVRIFKADKKAQGDPFLKTTIGELETLSAQITSAILQDKTISSLEAADSARDKAVKALGTVLAAYAVFPIASKKELAAPLKAVYDKYAKSRITSASYTSESSMIESMLEDFSAASLSENITGLEGIAESLAAIRAAQDSFTRANDEYVKGRAHKKAAASSFNKPIVSLINDKLVPYLNAMLISGNESCAAFAQSVEAEISRVNETIARRKKKGAAKTETA